MGSQRALFVASPWKREPCQRGEFKDESGLARDSRFMRTPPHNWLQTMFEQGSVSLVARGGVKHAQE